jgi:hypothetical protein
MRSNRKKNKKSKNKRNRGGRNGYSLPSGGYSTRQRPRLTFLDPHMYITLRYAENISTSVVTVSGSNQIFRLNSIFDPNAAVGGTQPYGYDQVAALYNRYRVLKTRWKVIFAASTAGYAATVVPINGALSSAVSDLTTLTSSSMVPFARYFNYNLGAMPPKTSGSMNLNVLGGVARVEYLTDDRFEAQIGANPAEVISLNIGIYNPSGGTITISYFVELWYEVDLHDPISLAAS